MSDHVGVLTKSISIRPSRQHLFGASAAQGDLKEIFDVPAGSEFVVFFDFTNATSISGSYIRATVGWCLTCGRMHAEGIERSDYSDSWAVRPLPVYPVITGGNRDILWEIHDFLKHREMTCLLVQSHDRIPFKEAEILGKLDDFLFVTLRKVASAATASAQFLKESSLEKITVGGWSNRLAALLASRLVMRIREGKTWNYQALGKEYKPWD